MFRDPFPLYRWLRDHEPVHWSTSLNGWVVTRFADVLDVFEQPRTFSVGPLPQDRRALREPAPGGAGRRRRPGALARVPRPARPRSPARPACRARSRRSSSRRAATASRRPSTRSSTASLDARHDGLHPRARLSAAGDGDRGPDGRARGGPRVDQALVRSAGGVPRRRGRRARQLSPRRARASPSSSTTSGRSSASASASPRDDLMSAACCAAKARGRSA